MQTREVPQNRQMYYGFAPSSLLESMNDASQTRGGAPLNLYMLQQLAFGYGGLLHNAKYDLSPSYVLLLELPVRATLSTSPILLEKSHEEKCSRRRYR